MKVLYVICVLSFASLVPKALGDEAELICQNVKCKNYQKLNKTSCECECGDGCNACYPPQIWNSKYCYCECERKLKCNPKFQYWDEQSCSCKCSENRRGCCDGKVWNKEKCYCECVNRQECPTNMEFNFSECRCTCKEVKNCTEPYVWLEDSCTCGCPEGRCADNFIRNSTTCKCDCNQSKKLNCTTSITSWNSRRCQCECNYPEIRCPNGSDPDPRANCTSCIYRQKVGCPGKQRWNRTEGKCMCAEEKKDCAVYGDGGIHIWDDINCECTCNMPSDQIACSPDEYFDYTSCSCICNVRERECMHSLVWNPLTCKCGIESALPSFDKLVQFVNESVRQFPRLKDLIEKDTEL